MRRRFVTQSYFEVKLLLVIGQFSGCYDRRISGPDGAIEPIEPEEHEWSLCIDDSFNSSTRIWVFGEFEE
jgi:hypothetical protein